MGLVIYKNPKIEVKDSWIKYFLSRIKQNKNNLVAVIGSTGSGKTWSAISICEKMSKENGVYFGIENIIFTLKDLMALINSGDLKAGSCIIFDEPQISISSREFQSEANRIFNYLLTTFRHRNLSLFFCTPFEDLLDLSTRKLFHVKFSTLSLDRNKKTCKWKGVTLQYNSQRKKFYEKFLRIVFPVDNENLKKVLKSWSVSKPSEELIKVYEKKKTNFTTNLNKEIEERLNHYDNSQKQRYGIKDKRKRLTEKQKDVLVALANNKGNIKATASYLGTKENNVYFHQAQAFKKDYEWKEFIVGDV